MIWHWLAHAFSTYFLHTQHGAGYQWTSGPEARISYLGVFALVIGAWKHWNCQAPWCFRHGPHKTADGQHHLCRKHHPDLPNHRLSLAEIHERHNAAKQS